MRPSVVIRAPLTHPASRYGVAVAAAGLAVLARLSLDPVWGSKLPFITAYPALMVCAWLGGFGPGLVTTVLGAAAAAYLWMPPGAWAVGDTGDVLALLVFVTTGVVISGLNEAWRRTAARLASEVDTTQAFFESAAEGIVVVDRAGRITRINARGAQLFGYERLELVGQSVDVLLPERFRAKHAGHRRDYLAFPRIRAMGLGLDLFGRRKDGTEFPIEISLSPVKTASGPLAMALVTDITERRALEQAAQQQEKSAALATLAAGIAHEINNPIGIVSTRVELMLDDAPSQSLPRDVVEDLRVLHRNIQRIATIAKGLLSFARQAPQAPAPVDLNAVVEETLLLMRRQLGKDGILVELKLDSMLGRVWGSGTALQQVLTNLLLNARDAMPRGGDVRIETAPEPARAGWLRLTIADTGSGMRPELLEKVWEPFYTTKASGTGLGLSVTRRIIREHGGTVEVQSEPSSGTTFVISLPLHSSPDMP
jgi:PAS domain S-box-containing protein